MELKSITFPGLDDPYLAAPGGYGLGTMSPKSISGVDALDAATANGWYYVTDLGGASFGGVSVTQGLMFVLCKDSYNARQYLYQADSNVVLYRAMIGTVWGDWCCENPPMVPGVEYRTTERWNGNVVYAKLVNCGTAINDATVILEGVTACVRFIGYLSYPSETDPRKQLPIWSGSTIGTGYHAEITQPASPYGINQFIIKTDSNADGFGNGGYNWYVHAWYTKD